MTSTRPRGQRPVRDSGGRATDALEQRAAQVLTLEELAELLRALRRRHARDHRDSTLTYRELAARTGWSHAAIAEYFSGRTLPPTDRLDALTRMLGASTAEQGALATARDRVEERRRSGRATTAAAARRPKPSRNAESSSNVESSRSQSPSVGSSSSESGGGSNVDALAGVRPRQLPAAPPHFVGRVAELAVLTELADRSAAAGTAMVFAIAGTPGVGKTTLAIHWAHQIAHRFTDGQLYLNLRGFHPTGPVDPLDAVRGILDALQVPSDRIPASAQAQAALYRTVLSGRRMLLVLDNARDAEQVRPLLPGSSGCLVVVTSRTQLTGLVAAEGAHPVTLDVLSTKEARELLASRLGRSRIAAEPTAANAIIDICARLPLALSVVTARAATQPGLTLKALAGQLDRARLDALGTGDIITDVRAVFSWSYRCLTEDAARLFRLLGLHPGPDISTAAMASLIGLSVQRTIPMLAELTGAHLIAEHAADRYSLHDLLRTYAAEQTHLSDPDEDRQAASRRVLDHYLHTAHAADHLLDPHRDTVIIGPPAPATTLARLADHGQAMQWFTDEISVLRAVIDDAAATGQDTHAWQLAWTLKTFLARRGDWHDQLAVLQTAVAAGDRLADPTAQVTSHRNLAIAYLELGRTAQAQTHLQQALAAAERAGSDTEQARTHISLGYFWAQQGNPDRALAHAEDALSHYQASDNQAGQARALNQIGWCHSLLDDHQQALTRCRQALALHQELENQSGQAGTWDSLGYAHHHLGQYTDAIACYRQALDITRALHNRHFEAETMVRLGDTYHAVGDHEMAHTTWQQALAILESVRHPQADRVRAKLAGISGFRTAAPPK